MDRIDVVKPIESKMKTHTFTIILADAEDIVDDMSMTQEKFLRMSDALFEAGCDDSSPGVCRGVVAIDFDREAKTLRAAIESAVADVERAGYRIARVEPSDRETFDEINSELSTRPDN